MSDWPLSKDHYTVIGALASPFSIKMRAIMRYRRLAHIWVLNTPEVRERTSHVKPPIVPKVHFPEEPEETWHVDSSPLAYTLEDRHKERSIFPPDAAHAFLAHLLEDFGDEWGTKMMFHYRWADTEHGGDRDAVGQWMLYPSLGPSDDETLHKQGAGYADYQIPLWPVAGIEPQNVPLIEETYRRILDAMEDVLRDQLFFFGSRPSLGDFGFYGQLYQSMMNPASHQIMRQRTRRLSAWLAIADDASGVDGEWIAPDAALCRGVNTLLWLAGEVYLPYLDATERALRAGEERLRIEALDHVHEQKPMQYHAKCLKVMRDKLAALPEAAQQKIKQLVQHTDCWRYLRPE